jgi:hypothetical protein
VKKGGGRYTLVWLPFSFLSWRGAWWGSVLLENGTSGKVGDEGES